MPQPLLSRAVPALPAETLAEIHDGLALALDVLDTARRCPRAAYIEEAAGHLRYAERRARALTEAASLT